VKEIDQARALLDAGQPVSAEIVRAQIARLEAEARAVLWDVEPRHAARERDESICTLAEGSVRVLQPRQGKLSLIHI
jgi:hypothetical protein